MATAAVSDVRSRRIPNTLVALTACIGIAFSVAAFGAAAGALRAVEGLALGLVLWFPFFAVRWIGAGDVKLFAAAGAWLGPTLALYGALAAALLGGVLAVFWMLRTYGFAAVAARITCAVARPAAAVSVSLDPRSRGALPYGVSLAAGAVLAAWLPQILEGSRGFL